jgi:hypothetical protein
MSQNGKWFILKIFPKFINLEEAFQKVCDCEARYRKELEYLAGDSVFYHLHYVDTSENLPEGPHFKFFVKIHDTKKFLEWKKCNESNAELLRIEPHDDEDNSEHKQGVIARQVFESVKNIGKSNMIELKSKLRANKMYSKLNDTGKHYLRNMLKMTYTEEQEFTRQN